MSSESQGSCLRFGISCLLSVKWSLLVEELDEDDDDDEEDEEEEEEEVDELDEPEEGMVAAVLMVAQWS